MTSAKNWKQTTIQRLTGSGRVEEIPAQSQIVTERWHRIIRVPYLVYMPEKDRLLMLVSGDFPLRPMIMASDDHGATWSDPRRILDRPDDPKHHVAVGLTYLGKGKLIFCTEEGGRFFSEDYGQTWGEPVPQPPMSNGKAWYQWDPLWVDRNPRTGQVDRVWRRAGTSSGKLGCRTGRWDLRGHICEAARMRARHGARTVRCRNGRKCARSR